MLMNPEYEIIFALEMVIECLQGETAFCYDLLHGDFTQRIPLHQSQECFGENLLGIPFFIGKASFLFYYTAPVQEIRINLE